MKACESHLVGQWSPGHGDPHKGSPPNSVRKSEGAQSPWQAEEGEHRVWLAPATRGPGPNEAKALPCPLSWERDARSHRGHPGPSWVEGERQPRRRKA